MQGKWIIYAACVAALLTLAGRGPCAAREEVAGPGESRETTTLARAVMCEAIAGYEPAYVSVVFSVNSGKISCYTAFDNIPAATQTTHRWYRRDDLVTTKRLALKPPRWATYSSIQLREADKGPWRVEIFNEKDKLLRTLRFSVTD
jgi:hypothetical protein